MSVGNAIDNHRFAASSAELKRIAGAQTPPSFAVLRGLSSLTDQLIDRMRPGAGRSATLGPSDVAALEQAASAKGPEVEAAFKRLIKDALDRKIDLGGTRGPLLLLDEAARAQLATFAGLSQITSEPVRGGLAPQVTPHDTSRPATERMLSNQALRMEGLKGLARSGKKEDPPSETAAIRGALKDVDAGVKRARAEGKTVEVGKETLEALGPHIDEAMTKLGSALWADDRVKAALGRLITDPTKAKSLLPLLCKDSASTLLQTLGVKAVNEGVVKEGLKLLPSIGAKLGVQGMEKTAAKLGKTLLKEGAEELVQAGAKQGVKKGVMGLLSAVPLANIIPMLFTGGEMLAEFTKKPPDKRVLGKGLATFALQIGALAFPPLGLAATAVDLTGSVAISVSDAAKGGLSKEERQAKAKGAISKQGDRSSEMKEAISSNADLTSHALNAMERSFRELGSGERADRAKALGERARALHENPDDEEATKVHHDIGRFSFDTVLPEMIDQVKRLRDEDPEDRDNWSLMGDGLSHIGASMVGVRTHPETGELDPERNEPKLKMLLSGILKTGFAGAALAREVQHVAKVADDAHRPSTPEA